MRRTKRHDGLIRWQLQPHRGAPYIANTPDQIDMFLAGDPARTCGNRPEGKCGSLGVRCFGTSSLGPSLVGGRGPTMTALTNHARNKLLLGTAVVAAFVFVFSIVLLPPATTFVALMR